MSGDDRRAKKPKKEKKSKTKKNSGGGKRRPVKEESEISSEDYFAKNNEFRLWLLEEYDIKFDDLDSRKAKKKFRTFVEDFNDGYLDKKYYDGVHNNQVQTSSRTSHKWGFAKKVDKQAMTELRDEIDAATYATSKLKSGTSNGESSGVVGMGFADRKRSLGPAGPPQPSASHRTDKYSSDIPHGDYRADRYDRRREDDKISQNANKPTSTFEKKMEQKAMRILEKRSRQLSPEPAEADPYNDNAQSVGNSQREAKRQKYISKARSQKNEERQVKLNAYNEKESSTMAMFKEMAKKFE
ncbi:hypothetical protein SARC_05335 [Sphaeroforma arctica JP610]|uniref:Uncharacterized protein n=1 Tax=Sphaeroforma arctica JP610 TaxID=667725 RepID=A0A0L0G0J9_9EUKA|nr:hypothetical protein SARC_05335 [Sphaeroforma arctica JP610]KNC82384.1 hypothetical protein SARC_05335 [Sphaeroforma arctica JP610]|eukprot:XP_014156286.1 hypothetical protein SARC_05335 [Sphaeroforma arctica JP610]